MSGPILVCFAVSQEAKPFRDWARGRKDIQIILTGMGARNAERSIKEALEKSSPRLVLSCGFAGALNPALRIGDLIFDQKTTSPEMAAQLISSGAAPASFHCTRTVAVTTAAKAELHKATSADAVEMESQVIHGVCSASKVSCVTLRAISDTAREDLPLDFNALLTADEQLNAIKLSFAILRAPHKIPALMRLGRNSALAAKNLSCAVGSTIDSLSGRAGLVPPSR